MKWFWMAGVFSSVIFTQISLKAQNESIYIVATDTVQISKEQPAAPQVAVVRAPVIRPKRPKPITKELSGGVQLNTDGWGLFAEKGWVQSEDEKNSDKFYDLRFLRIEFLEHNHPKEIRLTNTDNFALYSEKPRTYIFGKTNNFYALRIGYGDRKMIAGKPEPGTISIHWSYSGGVSAGLLKPYYIDAYVPQDNPGNLVKKSIKFSEETRDAFLNQRYIVGSSGFLKGLGETQVVPGLQARTGLHFDFATNAKTKLALEVGMSAEIYTRAINIMAEQKSYPYFLNGYIAFSFGKRY